MAGILWPVVRGLLMTGRARITALALLLCSGLLWAAMVLPHVVNAQGGESCMTSMEEMLGSAATCSRVAPGVLCPAGRVEVYDPSGQRLGNAPALPLEDIERVETHGAAPNEPVPGISVLSMPGLAEGERLTAVLFGEATLVHEPGPPVAPACNAVSIGTVNIRQEPNTESAILGQLSPGASVPITARLADGSWWRVRWEGRDAWVFAQLAPADCDPALMLVIDPLSGEVSGGLPAPAFQGARLQTSFLAPGCTGAPRGGLLLQSEDGKASWRINGLTLTLEGTALVQGSLDDVLAVQIIEGYAVLVVGDVNRRAEAGQMIRVPMSGGAVAGVPGPALSLVTADVTQAPLGLLPHAVTPPAEALPVPEPGADGTLRCTALTQQVPVAIENGQGRVSVALEAGQAIRVSFSGASVTGLAVLGPDGVMQSLALSAGTALAADYLAREAGTYVFVAEAMGDELLAGVTCDLPQASTATTVQACEDILLRWDEVSGREVRFSAPAGAQVSAIVQHRLPSEGDARQLSAMNDAGNALLTDTAFRAVADHQVAGPLDFVAPTDGVYVLRWDGDPFNLMQVEVLCFPPNTAGAEGTTE